MNTKVLHNLLIPCLVLASSAIKAASFPANYQATYTVSRGGKVMAEQTSTFKSIAPNQYTYTDATIGTQGLASFTGFERTESTHFQFEHDQVIAVEHEMHQKVAFKSKSYQFKTLANNNTINGQYKQEFTLESAIKPISSHMLPLWLSAQVCDGTNQLAKQTARNIKVSVLKSKRIRVYEFSVVVESPQLYRVNRIYPENTQRSSQIWLDKKRHCLPVRSQHQEADEPLIETKLTSHTSI